MEPFVKTENLSVGYDGNVLIHDISWQLEKGSILTLIGPNGAGKSTILKTITNHLKRISGSVFVDKDEISAWTGKVLAKKMAVVLTDRIRPELMTCAEVVAMGRYPYTNAFGKLTREDTLIVQNALERVHALDLADRDFTTLSDGQRQRVMLARAICQEPEVLILDEPTAYLDIRHKIELLDILRDMAHTQEITIIMSLHEIDLAAKISDFLLCVKGDTIAAFGRPDEILQHKTIEHLYDMEHGSYNLLFGSVELTKPAGKPEVFVVAGGGFGIPYYRALQKADIPFATGILFENDVDYQVARELSDHVIAAPAFEPMTEQHYEAAAAVMRTCKTILNAGTPAGTFNAYNQMLLKLAEREQIPTWNRPAK